MLKSIFLHPLIIANIGLIFFNPLVKVEAAVDHKTITSSNFEKSLFLDTPSSLEKREAARNIRIQKQTTFASNYLWGRLKNYVLHLFGYYEDSSIKDSTTLDNAKVNSNRQDDINLQDYTKVDLTAEKKILVAETLKYLSKEDRDNLEVFLKNNNLTGEKSEMATLLYFYPSGFIKKPEDMPYEVYLGIQTTNFFPIGQQVIDFDGYATYINSFLNYSFSFPNDWQILSFSQPQFGAMVPEARMEVGKTLLPQDEIFGTIFYKFCDFNTVESAEQFRTEAMTRIWGFVQEGKTEYIDNFAGRSNLLKVVLKDPKSNFVREQYYFKEGESVYEISLRYSSLEKDKYIDDGLKIAESLNIGDSNTCAEDYYPLSKKEADLFFEGVRVSRYHDTLVRGGMGDFK